MASATELDVELMVTGALEGLRAWSPELWRDSVATVMHGAPLTVDPTGVAGTLHGLVPSRSHEHRSIDVMLEAAGCPSTQELFARRTVLARYLVATDDELSNRVIVGMGQFFVALDPVSSPPESGLARSIADLGRLCPSARPAGGPAIPAARIERLVRLSGVADEHAILATVWVMSDFYRAMPGDFADYLAQHPDSLSTLQELDASRGHGLIIRVSRQQGVRPGTIQHLLAAATSATQYYSSDAAPLLAGVAGPHFDDAVLALLADPQPGVRKRVVELVESLCKPTYAAALFERAQRARRRRSPQIESALERVARHATSSITAPPPSDTSNIPVLRPRALTDEQRGVVVQSLRDRRRRALAVLRSREKKGDTWNARYVEATRLASQGAERLIDDPSRLFGVLEGELSVGPTDRADAQDVSAVVDEAFVRRLMSALEPPAICLLLSQYGSVTQWPLVNWDVNALSIVRLLTKHGRDESALADEVGASYFSDWTRKPVLSRAGAWPFFEVWPKRLEQAIGMRATVAAPLGSWPRRQALETLDEAQRIPPQFFGILSVLARRGDRRQRELANSILTRCNDATGGLGRAVNDGVPEADT